MNINKLTTQLEQNIKNDREIVEDDLITDQYDETYYFLKGVLGTYNKFRSDKSEVMGWVKEIDIRRAGKERVFLKSFNDNIQNLYYKE